jgi:hypothetical protein
VFKAAGWMTEESAFDSRYDKKKFFFSPDYAAELCGSPDVLFSGCFFLGELAGA